MMERVKLYGQLMRVDRPIGTWLVFWPTCWGLLWGGQGYVPVYLLMVFLVGSFLTRSAGCVLNDLADHKLDAEVERTKTRPLAAGLVRKKEALALAALLLMLAGGLLFLLPTLCMWIALIAVPMIAAYPFMKRITYWPQLFLGITFNLGCLIGVVAMEGELTASAWLLYIAAICWTLGYDSIYAYQDREDDLKIGIKSTIIGWGKWSEGMIALSFLVMVGLLLAVGYIKEFRMIYFFMIALLVLFLVLEWSKRNWKNSGLDALQHFKLQHWVGAWVAWAIFLGWM